VFCSVTVALPPSPTKCGEGDSDIFSKYQTATFAGATVLTWIERNPVVAEVGVGLRQRSAVVGTIGHAKQGTAPELLDS
jgi:hypothetical protein